MQDLPRGVAGSWDRIGQLRLRPLAEAAALADGNLPRPARDLLDEVKERRRLILTSRIFASAASAPAQLETLALQ